MHALVAPLVLSLALGQAAPAPAPDGTATIRWRALAPALLGGVTLLGGAAFVIVGQVQWVKGGNLPTQAEVEAAQANAASNVVGGVALLGFGALSLALAAVLFFWLPAPDGAQVALTPLDGGGLFSLGLRLP